MVVDVVNGCGQQRKVLMIVAMEEPGPTDPC